MQQMAWGPVTATWTGELTEQLGRKRDREMRDGWPCYTHAGLWIRWDSCTYFLKQTQHFSLIKLSWVSVDRNESIPLNFFNKQTTNSKREMKGQLDEAKLKGYPLITVCGLYSDPDSNK